ncbi:MAG: hypothetical protein IJ284_04255 [Clostridia bacterium]|nr:hypothetical protein [Clostridia bacterium]
MSVWGKMQEKRWLMRLLVYIVDALIVFAAAFSALLLMTWGADFRFVEKTAVWVWIFANVVLALSLYTLMGMYSMGFSSVGMPEAMRVVVSSAVIGASNVLFLLISSLIDHAWMYANGFSYTVMVIYSMLLLGMI